jgi:hypothetical protein
MPGNEDRRDIGCAELQRRLLVDPFDPDPALLLHRQRCARCARAAGEAMLFESALHRVLAVDPTPGLARRIVAEQRRRANRRIAAAAGLLASRGLAAWVGYWVRGWAQPAPTLAQRVREHIECESPHLHQHADLSNAQVAAVLRQLGGNLVISLGRVDFAGICPMHPGLVAHLVVEGAEGPVSVLFMPGEYLEGPQTVRSRALQGMLVPTAYGSLAVVGGPGEPVEAFVKRIGASVTWSR